MSAKDPRKAIALRLDPQLYDALARARRRLGARSMAEAARRLARQALDADAAPLDPPPDMKTDAPTDLRPNSPLRPPRRLRVQLEPALRRRLIAAHPGAPEAALTAALRSALATASPPVRADATDAAPQDAAPQDDALQDDAPQDDAPQDEGRRRAPGPGASPRVVRST